MQKIISEVFDLNQSERIENILNRYPYLKDVLAGKIPVILWPAANMSRLAAKKLREHGIEVLGFGDSNQKLHGKYIEGLNVFSSDQILESFKDTPILIASTIYDSAITEHLSEIGIKKIIPVGVMNTMLPDVFISREHFNGLSDILNDFNREKIVFAKDIFADEISKQVFINKLLFYVTQQKSYLDKIYSANKIYFDIDFVKISDNECVVDAGAYIGDTFLDYVKFCGDKFKSYYAFEPDDLNFKELEKLAVAYGSRLHAIQAGISNQSGYLNFEGDNGTSSKLTSQTLENTKKIKVVKLDEYIDDDFHPSYIKMDIEGAETDALDGSKMIIKKYNPKLAISVYHHPRDLWELPLLIHKLNPDYRLYLRHYSREVADTVCYAFIE